MVASMHEIGHEKNRVLVVDDFMDEPEALIRQAQAMAPFKTEDQTYYPGLRRVIRPEDIDTTLHVRDALEALAPLIHTVFGVRRFMATEASFCLVTKTPDQLNIGQRLPHHDHIDPGHYALLHYLSRDAETKGGTSFYRHRATGFERINADRLVPYDLARRAERAEGEPPKSYFDDSDRHFERIARFSGKFNRLLIYRGSLLHSGNIPEDFSFSTDPVEGRLTCNIFIQGEPETATK